MIKKLVAYLAAIIMLGGLLLAGTAPKAAADIYKIRNSADSGALFRVYARDNCPAGDLYTNQSQVLYPGETVTGFTWVGSLWLGSHRRATWSIGGDRWFDERNTSSFGRCVNFATGTGTVTVLYRVI